MRRPRASRAAAGRLTTMRTPPMPDSTPTPTTPNLAQPTHAGGDATVPDLSAARAHFPSLALDQEGRPVVYLDNPGGTQVAQACMDGIVGYLLTANANTHGAFLTSARSDALLERAHAAMADFLNAADPRETVFGPNMTTLTFAMSRAIGRTLSPGDEIVVTALDHAANVDPWLALAEERGAVVRVAGIHPETCTLDMDDLCATIGPRTRVVAVGYASNAAGTINDVATIIGWAKDVGALSYVDAVQYAPHGPIDVQALGCDFLACSAYKFFGPHLGILYGRLPLLTAIAAYKVRPSDPLPPGKWETGTQNHECLAGVLAAVEYVAELGQRVSQVAGETCLAPTSPQHGDRSMSGRRMALHAAMAAI